MKLQDKILGWQILVMGATVGLLASAIQTVERIQFAENPGKELVCDVSAIFSCSNVFDAWQSSVFGFSNSIMCLAFFGVLLGIGLAGVSGAKLSKNLRLSMQFFSVFFLGFGAWYLQQSTFVIGYICLYCLLCYSGVIAMNWAWLRINVTDLPMSKNLQTLISKGYDTAFWLVWAAAIASMIIMRFYL